MRFSLRWVLVAGCVLAVGCANASQGAGDAIQGFASESDIDAFARKMQKNAAEREKQLYDFMATEGEMAASEPPSIGPSSGDAPAEAADAAAEPAAADGEQITNVQEQGVDEGGIVKNAGDFLIVLRRGRLFTIRTGGAALSPVDSVDAFPPGKASPGDTWYDEMLVADGQVIVIGYSYGDAGTEVNRFTLSRDGKLAWRDTHYLSSGDYYSSSNYASRLIGDELVFYAPVIMNWSEWRTSLPSLTPRLPGGGLGTTERLVQSTEFRVPKPYRDGDYVLDVMHTVTRCDLTAPRMHCEASAVAGGWSREFYVARDAVYVWTSEEEIRDGAAGGMLYRLPLDGAAPQGLKVKGGPIDQFSFREDAAGGKLNILLRAGGYGSAMWSSEVSDGDVALLTLPLSFFGDGSGEAPRSVYRDLPAVEGWRLQNRYVGRHLLYAANDYGEEARAPLAWVVPLDGGDPVKLGLPHGVTRFDVLGADAVAIGPARGGGLGFTSIALSGAPGVEDSYTLPAAQEGEVRSQAFFYRPDPGSEGGVSGTLGLPVARRLARDAAEFLGNGSAIFYLRRDNRRLSPAGELAAASESARDDACIASCVDWYGNARPIFLGNRIFALMGYELVEGRLDDGNIRELRRIDFTPVAQRSAEPD